MGSPAESGASVRRLGLVILDRLVSILQF
eukprot:SAG22_NODE_11497_length_481_cov_1.481675_1_plen_28_part_10